ncbi:group II intron reverse transcriptase/maturase [Pseudoalteromonas piscicida]|uniref:group II intron reverse transcriptase/maturase n=1 Tax=Pseudoalteromonas piscicida TaxID=43662 RepID=UPI001C958244|nr:group II intron reverse transcriptase/maturase [Pseudoalteromonas piscicida]QZO11379.1 group II intron reverse transcriptase/maturase [Pseudoalteromonas piscicida]QZO14569.1 group II intron reverse transcriptase/maturase [Pseudoalteromonas piscicida]QZO14573.1 group II intron reverse transcriptase/maturase [Pseudoalteromonas piscicida]QZO15653.1 group II intron reverse transcriptase/maturase [Pseudoalteromonas piscicida]
MSYLHNYTPQPCGSDMQRNAVQSTFNFDLFEHVLSNDNLQRAWKQVKANKGAAGVDGMKIDQFIDWAKQHWQQCKAQLENGTYRPQPVKRVEIDKPDGGKRQLGIPTVVDRVIQQAITQVLSPIIDSTFSDNSFGFRPNRNGQQAVKQVQQIIKSKRNIAVDVDLSKFFDRVNHDLLMRNLSRHVKDKRLLKLIGRYLRAGIDDNGTLIPSLEGVPQGGPLSPLLSNIMLDDLDKELEQRGHQFARYADDFIILVKSKRAGERVLASVTRFLETKLKLLVNMDKSQVVKTTQSKFLGFTFKRGAIKWHDKTLHKFKRQVRTLTNRNWGVSMQYQLFKLSQYLSGWINYFGIANAYQQCVDLDQWIRRRIRMCYWRQWRKPRTKVRNLMKHGVHVQAAVACGITSKGPWRSSKTPGIQQALSLNYLKNEGLYSLKDGWIKVHYPNG